MKREDQAPDSREDQAPDSREDQATIPREDQTGIPREDQTGIPREDQTGIPREDQTGISRRTFLQGVGGAVSALGVVGMAGQVGAADEPNDAGSEDTARQSGEEWQPIADRKVRVGIAGYGACKFGAQFFFHEHPNVEVVAVTDLAPERRDGLAKACGCAKTYRSCEEMVEDDLIEAVFIATDAPSHARLAIDALQHGKHVASAVPAVYGPNAAEDAGRLFQAVRVSGKKYMMFETSTFHRDCYAHRMQYQAGALGKLIYSEGEYYHYMPTPIDSYNPQNGNIDDRGWRRGLPPMWYPTHSTAYYVSVSGGRLTEVSGVGVPSVVPHLMPANNLYQNSFGTEIALHKTSEGGTSRMAVSWDMPIAHGEKGRVYGQKLGYEPKVNRERPPLPPRVSAGGHGGSHGYLMSDFIESILRDRPPIVGIGEALNMTLAGVFAHRSALAGGEWLKIPQYEL